MVTITTEPCSRDHKNKSYLKQKHISLKPDTEHRHWQLAQLLVRWSTFLYTFYFMFIKHGGSLSILWCSASRRQTIVPPLLRTRIINRMAYGRQRSGFRHYCGYHESNWQLKINEARDQTKPTDSAELLHSTVCQTLYVELILRFHGRVRRSNRFLILRNGYGQRVHGNSGELSRWCHHNNHVRTVASCFERFLHRYWYWAWCRVSLFSQDLLHTTHELL